jgi:hypothetical protein
MSRRGPLFLTVYLAFIIALSCFATAQPKDTSEPTREQLLLQISILQDHIKKLEGEAINRLSTTDPVLERAYTETRKKEYEYLTAMMDLNIGAFQAQRIASLVVLSLVVLIVLAGTTFAGFQLWKSVSAAGVQPSSDLELSASKVRVTSSVVGVVVLTISLVFLYIYAKEIYHIRVISLTSTQAETKPAN